MAGQAQNCVLHDIEPYFKRSNSPNSLDMIMYKDSSYQADNKVAFYSQQKPVVFNVDGWSEEMVMVAAKVAGNLGYHAEFQPRNSERQHRELMIYNEGADLAEFWRRLDEEGPQSLEC